MFFPFALPFPPSAALCSLVMRRFGRAGLILFVAFSLAFPAAARVELPDMGASAAAALTQEQEQRIGKAFWRQLRDAGKILEDRSVAAYLQDLGQELATGTPDAGQAYHFFAVNEPGINAFAVPGGYIGINTGLLLATEREDELAAVVAHEIAHVSQHHIARGVEKVQQSSLPMTAALIAAMLLAGHDPQIAQAAIAVGTAGAAQMRIDFTRTHEHEADRVGIDLLASAGFDPRSMADFFGELQRRERFYAGVPEFLRTHPVNENRIADATARAASLGEPRPRNRDAYRIIKARLRVLTHRDPAAFAKELRSREAKDAADWYALGFAMAQSGQYAEARQALARSLSLLPGSIAILETLAATELAAGVVDVAIARYREALELYPGNERLSLGLAEALLANQEPDEAVQILDAIVRNGPRHLDSYRLLGNAHAQAGNAPASQLAVAEYYYRLGETHSAIDLLERARRASRDDYYLGSKIEARLEFFKREALAEQQ